MATPDTRKNICYMCDYEGYSSGALYTHIRRTHQLSKAEYDEIIRGARVLMAMKQEKDMWRYHGLVFVRE